jgi:Sigma-70, region 4
VQDDRLRLIFTCCHPALSTEAQVALTLRLLGGLSTKEVARSFLVAEPAMAQRLARAKRKIKAARIPYRVPDDHDLPNRLRPVLAVVYLVYNAGITSPTEPGLCSEAIRLARILATLMPDEPEVAGLLALLLLTESRRASRTRPDGSLVLLGEQDRTQWDGAMIEEGQAIVRRCIRRNQPGLSAPGRHQRRACRRSDNRADRLVADHRPLRSTARGRPDARRGPQPRHRHRRGARRRCCACSGRRIEPGQLPPVPRHASRSASAARPQQRGRGRLRARSRHGTHGRRARLPQARWPNFTLRRLGGTTHGHKFVVAISRMHVRRCVFAIANGARVRPLPRRTTQRGHKTDTSETTRATSRDASPASGSGRFAGETVSRVEFWSESKLSKVKRVQKGVQDLRPAARSENKRPAFAGLSE